MRGLRNISESIEEQAHSCIEYTEMCVIVAIRKDPFHFLKYPV
jgi:hypothetical protein